MIRFRSESTTENSSEASPGCIIAFGSVFLLMGLMFTVLVAVDFAKDMQARGWDKAPARLISAEVVAEEKQEDPFELVARYTYQYEGNTHATGTYSRKDERDDQYEKLALLAKDLREDSDLTARVNPEDPTQAILRGKSVASGLLILLPLIFVTIGGSLIFFTIRGMRKKPGEGSSEVEAISSSPTSSKGGAKIGIAIGLVLAAIGFGVFFPLGWKPLMMAKSAKNWIETPVEVQWAKVRSHDSDDGVTYSVDIFYSYEFDGQQHRSNRYSFLNGSSSGSSAKHDIVNAFRKDPNPVCYVNPSLPERAILKRELGLGALLALIPLAIFVGGLLLARACWRSLKKEKRKAKTADADGNPFTQDFMPSPLGEPAAGPRTMSPGKGRIGIVLGLLFAALFWNGLVMGFLVRDAWSKGSGLGSKLFAIPFILVGALIVVALIYSLFRLLNPKPVITLTPGDLVLGEQGEVRWKINGRVGRFQNMKILLKGVERATYTRGTDTVTAEETFYVAALFDTTDPAAMREGTAPIPMPHDLMYSMKLSNNEIAWRIEVSGEIPRWPDVHDKFDITVHPAPLS